MTAPRTPAFYRVTVPLVSVLLAWGAVPATADDAPHVLASDGTPVVATLTVADWLPLARIVTETAEDTISTAVVFDAEGRGWTTWTDHAGVLPHNDPGSPFATPARFTQHLHIEATGTLPPGKWTIYLAGSDTTQLVVPEGLASFSGQRPATEMEHVSTIIDPRIAGLSGPAAFTNELPTITRGEDTTSVTLGMAVVEHHQSGMHAVCLQPDEQDAVACEPVRGVGSQGFIVGAGGIGQGWVANIYPMYDDFFANTEIVPVYTVAAGSLTRYAYHVAFSIHHGEA